MFPPLIVVLVFSASLGWVLLKPLAYIELCRQAVASLLFLANINLYFQTSYFEALWDEMPLLHLWSLGVEEQFYIFFPILCVLASKKNRFVLGFWCAVCIIASMGVNLLTVKEHTTFAFYMPVTRFWEFFVGILLSYVEIYRNFRLDSKFIRDIISFIGLVSLILSVQFIKSTMPFPGIYAVAPCLGAVSLICAGEESFINDYILSNKFVTYIGSISYSLYLWHWPLLCFAEISSANQYFVLTAKLIILFLSFILAAVTYALIERPTKHLGRKKIKDTLAVLCLACFAVLGVGFLSIIGAAGVPSRFSPEIVALDHDYGKDAGKNWGQCFLDLGVDSSHFKKICSNINGSRNYSTSIFIWGDSHAADLMPGFSKMLAGRAVRIAEYTSSECPPILDYDVADRPLCRSTNTRIFHELKSQRPAVVVLSAKWPTDESAYQKLQSTIAKIQSTGVKKVLVFGPAPEWKKPVVYILETELEEHPDGTPSDFLPASDLDVRRFDETGLKAASVAAGAEYISLLDVLCTKDGCRVKTGMGWQNIVTYDDAHFTKNGAEYIFKHLPGVIFPP